MRGVKRCEESTGRMKKHRYSTEFKVTAVRMAMSLVQLASAIATGQPAAIAQAFTTLKDDTDRVKSKQA